MVKFRRSRQTSPSRVSPSQDRPRTLPKRAERGSKPSEIPEPKNLRDSERTRRPFRPYQAPSDSLRPRHKSHRYLVEAISRNTEANAQLKYRIDRLEQQMKQAKKQIAPLKRLCDLAVGKNTVTEPQREANTSETQRDASVTQAKRNPVVTEAGREISSCETHSEATATETALEDSVTETQIKASATERVQEAIVTETQMEASATETVPKVSETQMEGSSMETQTEASTSRGVAVKKRHIDLSEHHLTDSTVHAALQRELQGLVAGTCTELNLINNQLQSVPDISAYPQLRGLVTLHLKFNCINKFTGEGLPLCIAGIDMSHNQWTEIPDLHNLTNLKRLDISNNHISKVEGDKLPPRVEEINLSCNQVTDIQNLHKLTNLNRLFLTSNHISHLEGDTLPQSVGMILLTDNRFTELPDLRTLTNLKELYMFSNRISCVNGDNLPQFVEVIDLGNNQFTQLPDLHTLVSLKELYMFSNRISCVEENNLPPCLEVLDLSKNKFTENPDLHTLTKLKTLNLSSNQICHLEKDKLPLCVEVLGLGVNQITEIPDLHRLTYLKELNLYKNCISRVDADNLPQGVEIIYLNHNHFIEIPDLQGFSHLYHLDLSENKISQIKRIPPQMLFKCHLRLNPVTHIAKQCFTSSEEHHFLIAEIPIQALKEPPQEVFRRGWAAVLDYFSQELVTKSRNRLVLIGPTTAGKTSLMESLIAGESVLVLIENRTEVIDIKTLELSSDDYLEIFDQGGHPIYTITNHLFMCPKSTVLLVHDITKVLDQDMSLTIDILRQALHKHPENEMVLVLTHTDLLDQSEQNRNCQKIREKITDTINKEIDNTHRLLETQVSVAGHERRKGLLENLTKKRDMKHFLVSSKSLDGYKVLKKFLKKVAKSHSVSIPVNWINLFKMMKRNRKSFLTMVDVDIMLESLPHFNQLNALKYFNDTGNILFFETNPSLKNYVFHDLDFLIAAFKSAFHHNIEEVLDYNRERVLQRHFKEPEFKMAINQYQHEGLLSLKLLSCLWQQHGLDDKDQKALVELMKGFDVCYPMSSDETTFFVPWFVEQRNSPFDIDKIWMTTDKRVTLQLNCVFFNQIPLNVFEMMCVRLQKLAIENHYLGERTAWKHGLLVQFGSIKCMVMREESTSTIKFCVQGEVEDLIDIWMVMHNYYTNIESVLDQWNGVLKAIFILCSHCQVLGKKPAQEWLPKLVFPRSRVSVSHVSCPRDKEKVPRALVVALTEWTNTAEKAVLLVKKYLETRWKVKAPPATLPYVDCVAETRDTFQLSWNSPISEDGSTAVTGFVVQSRHQGGDWTRVAATIERTKYQFRGMADEFCVAAENRYGVGDFLVVRPQPELLDYVTDPDLEDMRGNKEAFCHMTCLQTVITRLFSRNDMPESIEHELSDILLRVDVNSTGSTTINKYAIAAGRLMEYVFRFQNKQLYYFKKILKETGQETLARAVPVRLLDNSLLKLEDM